MTRATPHCVAYSIAPKVPDNVRSALVQGRDHLRAARQDVSRQQRRWDRRFSRADREARLSPGAGRHRDLAAALLSSPLRDDGYDIADYYDVNPNYGTLDDFRAFLAAAHERGLRVITELVINHTSDQNPVVPEIAPRRARLARARAVCLERYAGKIQGRAHHLQGFRDLELVVGSGGESVLLASLLFASARFEFR